MNNLYLKLNELNTFVESDKFSIYEMFLKNTEEKKSRDNIT